MDLDIQVIDARESRSGRANKNGFKSERLIEAIISERGKLVSVAARILSDREMAEDVVQDVIVKVCDRKLTCDVCPKRFAMRMVRNLALDNLRRIGTERNNNRRCLLDGLLETISWSAQDIMEYAELLKVADRALGNLPAPTRRAFYLHRLDGVPQKDIARQFGLSPSRINMMIKEAHRKCLEELDELLA